MKKKNGWVIRTRRTIQDGVAVDYTIREISLRAAILEIIIKGRKKEIYLQ